MFSHNGLISEKQMSTILMLTVFSGGIFVLPYLFAVMFGNDILIGAVVFVIMAAIYVGTIFIFNKPKADHGLLRSRGADGEEEKIGKHKESVSSVFSYIGVIIRIIRYILRLIFYITLAVAIIGEGQVPFVDKDAGNSVGNLSVLLPLIIVAYYGANRNIEKQGRISEMILVASFFPYVIMILFGLKEMEWRLLIPHGNINAGLLLRCYALLTFLVPVEIYPQLNLNTEREGTSQLKIYIQVMLMIILVAVLSLLMAGIYGLNGMAEEPMISVAIMRYIELPLGVLQRFDVLMVWFFMTGVFAIISGVLFRIRKQLFKLVSKRVGEILLLIIAVATLFMCLRLPEYRTLLNAFVVYGAFVDVPLSILSVMGNGILNAYRYRRMLCVVLLVAGLTVLTGCSENVEQRDYATIMMVTLPEMEKEYHYTLCIAGEHRVGEKGEAEDVFEIGADNIDDLMDKYGERVGKQLSLSHLKVILTSVNYGDLLDELDEQQEIAKTCPMLIVEDDREIAQYLKGAKEPMGNYISNLIRNAKGNRRKIPKLMNYLKWVRDGIRVDMCYIQREEDSLIIVYK